MTKLFSIITIAFILIFLKSQSLAAVMPIDWAAPDTRTAVDRIASRLCLADLVFEGIDWGDFSFQEEAGEDAVRFLLNKAREIGNHTLAGPAYDSPNIFSLLGIALREGYLLEKNLGEAAKFLVWGHHLETLVVATVERAIAHAIAPAIPALYDLKEATFSSAIALWQAALEAEAAEEA